MQRRCRVITRDVEVLTRGCIETSRSRVRDIAGDLARCVIAVLWALVRPEGLSRAKKVRWGGGWGGLAGARSPRNFIDFRIWYLGFGVYS